MAPPARPSLSITLPPNFEFHYDDGNLPKTPTQQDEDTQQSTMKPPPPPRPHFKVRRKRATIPDFHEPLPTSASLSSDDTIIPTIEMSEAVSEMSSPTFNTMSADLLAPIPAMQRFVTPPKTPARVIMPSFNSPTVQSPTNEWALINDSREQLKPAFERTGSVCSSFSDSSVSSCGSSAYSAPNNGSCTSPDSDVMDPFLETASSKLADTILLSPDTVRDSSPTAKRVKIHRHVKWTQMMDDHLWMTYMQYLQDPRVTPFKMLPGTSPPLGVCSRVAAKAKRTWSSHKNSASSGSGDAMMREGSPDTIRPTQDSNYKQPQWPRSESATRRRLRSLCRRKPSLSAHYQRLLRARSPSPFASSTVSRSSEPAAFSSRDLNVSLVTATAQSMQPEGMLAQLASDADLAQPQTSSAARIQRSADWFARIPRSQAHQKSLSLQSGLSLNTGFEMPAGASLFNAAPTLASPFDDVPDRAHLLHSMSATKSLGRTGIKGGPSLDSPVELSGAPTAPRKRRFRSDEDKSQRPTVQDVFTSHYQASADEPVIVRNRGFTVGAHRATNSLANLFSPPTSSADHEMTEAPAVPAIPEQFASHLGLPGSRSAPRRLAEPIPRLGSPFTETQYNTFPRSYIPSSVNPQPFQQRLRELAAHNNANGSS